MIEIFCSLGWSEHHLQISITTTICHFILPEQFLDDEEVLLLLMKNVAPKFLLKMSCQQLCWMIYFHRYLLRLFGFGGC